MRKSTGRCWPPSEADWRSFGAPCRWDQCSPQSALERPIRSDLARSWTWRGSRNLYHQHSITGWIRLCQASPGSAGDGHVWMATFRDGASSLTSLGSLRARNYVVQLGGNTGPFRWQVPNSGRARCSPYSKGTKPIVPRPISASGNPNRVRYSGADPFGKEKRVGTEDLHAPGRLRESTRSGAARGHPESHAEKRGSAPTCISLHQRGLASSDGVQP